MAERGKTDHVKFFIYIFEMFDFFNFFEQVGVTILIVY